MTAEEPRSPGDEHAEENPHECVDVNVLGSQNVARAARDHAVSAVPDRASQRVCAEWPARAAFVRDRGALHQIGARAPRDTRACEHLSE